MEVAKKAIRISAGCIVLVTGIVAACIFLFGNLAPLTMLVGVSAGLVSALFGWLLMRRGSKNALEALGWLITLLIS
jgi:hypothetical protein